MAKIPIYAYLKEKVTTTFLKPKPLYKLKCRHRRMWKHTHPKGKPGVQIKFKEYKVVIYH